MGWKDWPYWIKGAIIAVLIFSFLFFSIEAPGTNQKLAPLSENNSGSFSLKPFLWSLLYLLVEAIIAVFFALLLHSDFEYGLCRMFNCEGHRTIIHFLIILFVYFILGAIIGLIYGRIKSRK